MSSFDTIIIGGGQCGIYAAKKLQDLGINYLLLERDSIGEVWDKRLKGMSLFTSRQMCHLPGLTFPGDANGFPSTAEVANYLRQYCQTFDLKIREKSQVIQLIKDDEWFLLTLNGGQQIYSKTVINATGSNQIPHIPAFSKQLSPQVIQYDSMLSCLDTIPSDKNVVVVGDGATGRQIAGRLAGRCSVTLSTGASRGLPPNRVLGKDLFWWLRKVGILFAGNQSIVAKILKKRNPVPCGQYNNRKLKNSGVTIKGRTINCFDKLIEFNDGAKNDVDIVIWTIGYQDNTTWLTLATCIDEKGFIHESGVTPEFGLYVVGRKWLSCRASELIMGVEKDVTHVVNQLRRDMQVIGAYYEAK